MEKQSHLLEAIEERLDMFFSEEEAGELFDMRLSEAADYIFQLMQAEVSDKE